MQNEWTSAKRWRTLHSVTNSRFGIIHSSTLALKQLAVLLSDAFRTLRSMSLETFVSSRLFSHERTGVWLSPSVFSRFERAGGVRFLDPCCIKSSSFNFTDVLREFLGLAELLPCLCRCFSFSVESRSDSTEFSKVKLLKRLEEFLRGRAGVGVMRREGVELFLDNPKMIQLRKSNCGQ